MPEIYSGYNIEKDARNWWGAMNMSTNGRGYESMSNEAQDIFKKIKGLSLDESKEILVPFLERKYNENREEIDDAAKQIKIKLDTQKDQILELMEKLTN